MFDSLKKMVVNLDYWIINRDDIPLPKDDICPKLSFEELQQKKLLLSYYDLPPIHHSLDLLY